VCRAAKKKTRVFTDLQEGLFPVMNEYKDLLFTGRTGQNAAEIRSLYVLHAINHLLKYALNVSWRSHEIRGFCLDTERRVARTERATPS
jgi:U3 small nucleolar RNA-associated protein 25